MAHINTGVSFLPSQFIFLFVFLSFSFFLLVNSVGSLFLSFFLSFAFFCIFISFLSFLFFFFAYLLLLLYYYYDYYLLLLLYTFTLFVLRFDSYKAAIITDTLSCDRLSIESFIISKQTLCNTCRNVDGSTIFHDFFFAFRVTD